MPTIPLISIFTLQSVVNEKMNEIRSEAKSITTCKIYFSLSLYMEKRWSAQTSCWNSMLPPNFLTFMLLQGTRGSYRKLINMICTKGKFNNSKVSAFYTHKWTVLLHFEQFFKLVFQAEANNWVMLPKYIWSNNTLFSPIYEMECWKNI